MFINLIGSVSLKNLTTHPDPLERKLGPREGIGLAIRGGFGTDIRGRPVHNLSCEAQVSQERADGEQK